MRFSILVALAVMGFAAYYAIESVFGEHAVIVYGLAGMFGVYLFFKHVVNSDFH